MFYNVVTKWKKGEIITNTTTELTITTFLDYINYINKPIKKIQRGSIVYSKVTVSGKTHLQTGFRPYLIVSNDICNRFSPVLTAIPLTTKVKKELPTHVDIDGFGLKQKSIALCEQIISIDKNKITGFLGQVDNETLEKITQAIKIQIGAWYKSIIYITN